MRRDACHQNAILSQQTNGPLMTLRVLGLPLSALTLVYGLALAAVGNTLYLLSLTAPVEGWSLVKANEDLALSCLAKTAAEKDLLCGRMVAVLL